MSFQSPWMLLGLLVIAAFVGVWLWAERRRARFAVRYTNLDVLATVVSGRSWPRFVPAVILVLGLGTLAVGSARPHVERTLLRDPDERVELSDAAEPAGSDQGRGGLDPGERAAVGGPQVVVPDAMHADGGAIRSSRASVRCRCRCRSSPRSIAGGWASGSWCRTARSPARRRRP